MAQQEQRGGSRKGLILDPGTIRGELSAPRPGRFTSSVSIVQDGWAGLTVCVDWSAKSHPPTFEPRTVQPVASRYYQLAVPAVVQIYFNTHAEYHYLSGIHVSDLDILRPTQELLQCFVTLLATIEQTSPSCTPPPVSLSLSLSLSLSRYPSEDVSRILLGIYKQVWILYDKHVSTMVTSRKVNMCVCVCVWCVCVV